MGLVSGFPFTDYVLSRSDISTNATNQAGDHNQLATYVTLLKNEIVALEAAVLGAGVSNVVTFGADPTGAADSTTAIQNALNATGGNNALFFPSGSYKVSETGHTGYCLDVSSLSGVRMYGPSSGLANASGSGGSATIFATSLGATSSIVKCEAGSLNHYGPLVENLRIERRTPNGLCFSLKLFNHYVFRNVTFRGVGTGGTDVGTGLKIDGSSNDASYGRVEGCGLHRNKFGLIMVNSSGATIDGNNYFETDVPNGIHLDFQAGSGHNHVIGAKFEGFSNLATTVAAKAIIGINVDGDGTTPVCTISNNSFEGVATGINLKTGSSGTNQGCSISQCMFTGHDGTETGVVVGASRGHDSISQCRFSNVATKTSGTFGYTPYGDS